MKYTVYYMYIFRTFNKKLTIADFSNWSNMSFIRTPHIKSTKIDEHFNTFQSFKWLIAVAFIGTLFKKLSQLAEKRYELFPQEFPLGLAEEIIQFIRHFCISHPLECKNSLRKSYNSKVKSSRRQRRARKMAPALKTSRHQGN